jgi:photosystem II stability/assembly factor-like uncharacterized protein
LTQIRTVTYKPRAGNRQGSCCRTVAWLRLPDDAMALQSAISHSFPVPDAARRRQRRPWWLLGVALAAHCVVRVAAAAGDLRKPTEHLYGVHAVDGRNVWAVGAFGTIFRSTDGGLRWATQETEVLEPLFDVAFADAQTGVVVGKSGVVLRTADGGAHWKRIASSTTKNLFKVTFADDRRAWAVGDWGVMLASGDGGATWTDRSLAEDVVLYSISFPDPQHGWIAGEFGTVLATTDGGATWERRETGTEKTLFGVDFTSATTGWVVGIDGLVMRTRDGGTTWDVQRGTTEVGSLEQLGFLDLLRNPGLYDIDVAGDLGCIVGDTGTVLVSTDAGETWAPRELPGDLRLLWVRAVSLLPGTGGLLVGAKGTAVPVMDGELRQPGTGETYAAQLGR